MEERSYFFGLQSPQKKDSHHIYIATFFSAKGTEYPEITIMANASEPVVARLMLPDDANLAGNVHGGTILQLMEQAGMIAATRYFNKPNTSNDGSKDEYQGKHYAGLARIETMSFHQPMFIGEIASLSAYLVFTSERSALVKVVVTAENAMKSSKRITNSGSLWYLSFVAQGNEEPLVVPVPQIPPPPEVDSKAVAEYNKAKKMYETRKNETMTNGTCLTIEGCLCPTCRLNYKPPTGEKVKSPAESQQMLSQMVLPGDCGTSHYAFGGFVMKLMDTAAGCCAYKHTRTNVVTVSISSMDFVSMVRLGDIVTIRAEMTFCSAKSMEILVSAYVTSMTREDHLVARGVFSFVSLDENNKVMLVPELKYETEDEFSKAFESQKRYMASKMERQGKK